MMLDVFFEKFGLFANAPDAVATMRELVLQLAVQGKLVNQNGSDGNASQLLAAISRERDVQAKNLRTPNEPASADGYEHAFPVPANWTWTQLGRIALQIQYGYTASADPTATDIRMLRITDIQNNQVDWSSVPGCRIAPEDAEKYFLSQNDILIARTGGTIGKSFIVPHTPVKSVFASYLIRVTPPSSIAARYLKTILESPLYWMQLRQMSAGTGQPNVNGQALGRLAIPLPPLAEQKRIVAKVDELMALCDRLEEQQQERETRHAALARASLARFTEAPTPANLEFLFHNSYAIPPADLRKSILTLAVQGKLVPQDSRDESAERLFADLELERRQFAEVYNFRSSCGKVSDKTLPFDVPSTWKWCALSSLFNAITDGDHLPPPKSEDGIAFLTIGNITTGTLKFEGCRFVPDTYYQGLADFRRPKRGDILYTVVGATYGRAALVETDRPFCVQRHIAILKPSQKIDVEYLMVALRSPLSYEQASESTTGTAQPTIPLGSLRNFAIPLPPIAEQRRIVAKVDELMALVDAIETQLTTARDTADELMQAVVQGLLNGSKRQHSPVSIVESVIVPDVKSKRPNRHFARALLSAEVVHQLHAEPTFGRIKHQKVFHLCESLARIPEVEGQYSRKAAGPFDNKLVYANESELKKQKWYDTVDREKAGHRYIPLEKAGGHARYVEQYWPNQLETIRNLIAVMRTWDTDRCEIFSTTYAAWNDLVIWGREPTDEAILHEILDRWSPEKRRFDRERWVAAIRWMKEQGYIPTGFGHATAEPE